MSKWDQTKRADNMIRLITLAKSFRIAAIPLATIGFTIGVGIDYAGAAQPQYTPYSSASSNANPTSNELRLRLSRSRVKIAADDDDYCQDKGDVCDRNHPCCEGLTCKPTIIYGNPTYTCQ